MCATTETINLKIDGTDYEQFPLRRRYASQQDFQRAFFELDEDGNVRATYNGEIGNAVPCTVWNGRTMRFGSNHLANYSAREIAATFAALRPLFERVHAGHSVEWNGSNHVGRLNADAEAAVREIEDYLENDTSGDAENAEWDENGHMIDPDGNIICE